MRKGYKKGSGATTANLNSQDGIRKAFEIGYRVDKNGVVKNPNGTILKCGLDKRGYLKFAPFKLVKIFVHRFQAYAKFGEKLFEKGMVVRHLDSNKLNNSLDNIAIGTQAENLDDNPKEIKEKIRKSNLKYSKELVDKLIEESGRGVTYEQLKTKYGIPLGSLCFLLSKTAKKRSTGQRY